MNLCRICRNITFRQVSEDDELEFKSEIYSDLADLREAAAKRSCRFCVLLHGLIEHKQWQRGITVEPAQGVTLLLGYPDEDLASLDLDGDDEDYPSFIKIRHPFGYSSIKIAEPKVLSRSLWDDDVDDDGLPAGMAQLQMDTSPPLTRENDSTGSDAALRLAAQWIDECRQNHTSCRRGALQQVKVPTRLVQVTDAGSPDGKVIIVSTSKAGLGTNSSIDSRYATLSHRWTPNNPHTLTTSNLNDLTTQGLRVSALSKTFAEACMTTHKMGLQYIWIDSLCILQDSGADKAVEIPLMGDYYENAELNIAAATEEIGGLWREREGLATMPMRLPIAVVLPDDRGTRRYMLDIAPVLQYEWSHLDSRGWILQERLFPLRTLFFDPYWISFDCAEMVASENCPGGVLKKGLTEVDTRRLATQFGSSKRDYSLSTTGGAIRRIGHIAVTQQKAQLGRSLSIGPMDRDQLYRLWFRVVRDFTRRSLTFESDRLPAISALAERLAAITNDDTYIAGMWKNELLRGLEWHNYGGGPMRKGVTRTPPSKAHAPSWSWASLEVRPHADDPKDSAGEPLPLDGVTFSEYEREIESQVSVLDVSWQAAEPGSLYGAVKNATITLRGRVIRGRCFSRYRPMIEVPVITAEGILQPVSDTSAWTQEVHREDAQSWPAVWGKAKLKPWDGWGIYASGQDASGRLGRMVSLAYYIDAGDFLEGFVYLLPLMKHCTGGNWLVFCLVLEDVGDRVTYRRVGAASFGLKSAIWAEERVVKLV
ncbi:heterokaryon incompatibility protein-domain-containing protein [Plectosphaerella cucumerina]|uniref:Heterokaryon incompatibility protein-domain-containing protein n=1 Tax=Plectosphaerella cucumerina TaxID=40658 RepID=A0A8K0T9Y0_9PEZI|nr:heterokaryon incompatibility protein-domain-containing protein [Plectosphaerella cucumerina]